MIDDGAFSACFYIFCFLLFVAFHNGIRKRLEMRLNATTKQLSRGGILTVCRQFYIA